MASATPRIEKSEVSDGALEFLFLMLSLCQPLRDALVRSKVHPPPFRMTSQYVFVSLCPGGLIVYWPSETSKDEESFQKRKGELTSIDMYYSNNKYKQVTI